MATVPCLKTGDVGEAELPRFELGTSDATGQCSDQLSYSSIPTKQGFAQVIVSDSEFVKAFSPVFGAIRTATPPFSVIGPIFVTITLYRGPRCIEQP